MKNDLFNTKELPSHTLYIVHNALSIEIKMLNMHIKCHMKDIFTSN